MEASKNLVACVSRGGVNADSSTINGGARVHALPYSSSVNDNEMQSFFEELLRVKTGNEKSDLLE